MSVQNLTQVGNSELFGWKKKFTRIAIFLTYIEPNATFPLGGIPFKKYTTCD